VPVGNAPAALAACVQPADQQGRRGYGVSMGCGAAGMLFTNSTGQTNSYAMSQQLLQVIVIFVLGSFSGPVSVLKTSHPRAQTLHNLV